MQYKYSEIKIKLRRYEYKICIPKYEFKELYANPRSNGAASALMVVSKEDMSVLAQTFYHYSRLEDTILYIKRNTSLLSFLRYNIPNRDKCVDIVLLNHKMQFKKKLWKGIRAGLTNRIRNMKQDDIINTDIQSKSYAQYGYRENRDYLDIAIDYSTIFLTGSKAIFESLGKKTFDLSCSQYSEFMPHFHAEYMIRDNKKEGCYNNDLIFYLFDSKSEQKDMK